MMNSFSVKYILTAFAILACCYLSAQVNIVPVQAGIYGYGYAELSQTNIINTSGTVVPNVYATVECTSNGSKVFAIRTSSLDLAVGSNFISYSQFLAAEQLSASPAYYQLQQSGRLPAGSYNTCITLYRVGSSTPLDQKCVNFSVLESSTLMLLSPFDKQVLHTFFPSLFWNFSYLNPDDIATYSIKVVEYKAGQTYVDAMAYNVPLLFEQNLMQTSYTYPASAMPLEESKKYLWQIEASVRGGKKYLSEIWMFQYRKDKKEEKVEKEKISEPYASLTKTLSSANYSFKERINFTYNNESGDTILEHKIFPEGSLRHFPLSTEPIRVKNGINRLSFDVPRNMRGKEASSSYTLEVYTSRNEVLKMKFYIQQKK